MRRTARWFVKIAVGLPTLLLGGLGIFVDIAGLIAKATDHDPHHVVLSPFPLGMIVGIAVLWLGYRLVFTSFEW